MKILKPDYFHKIFLLFTLILLTLLCNPTSGQKITIEKLKDLNINTAIVESGKSRAIIVIPVSGIYDEPALQIQNTIREKSGITIPISKKESDPEVLLRSTNVIVLGNMTSNPFIYKLYCQWYTLLDQKYPGKGGYVVRSLHDPYGTGRNVIEIGGSEIKGVTMAAEKFCELLPAGKTLVAGRLMEIKLGAGLIPPEVEIDGTGLDKVLTWMGKDWADKNTDSGFGWNPISLAGILYYMTGREEYIECFKNLVKPDPEDIPAVIRGWYSFVNMKRPLVEQVEEYTDHQVDYVWDLIEESPSLTDDDRLYITRELLDHQYFRDPDHTLYKLSPGRHEGFALLGIYSGSRYFAKYYPDPVWEKRLSNVRKSYNNFIGNPSFGNDNIFYWASFAQYIFEYFITDGYDEFVKSGTARTYMDALLLLRNGEKKGDYYNGITPYQLNVAAYSLKDNSYFWLMNELGYDDQVFRVGRSFWPNDDIAADPPGIANKFISFPLQVKDIPSGEGFEILSFRSGLTEKDDYFQLDGHNGGGRSAYHLNSILKLRMAGGKYLLDGINNDIDITCNGMTDSIVPLAAALKRQLAFNNMAYIRTEVPGMTNSVWQRNMLYLKETGLIVIDRTTARETSEFDIECSWTLPGNQKDISFTPDLIKTSGGTVISFAGQGKIMIDRGNVAKEIFTVRLLKGDSFDIGNLIYYTAASPPLTIKKTGKNNFMVTGKGNTLICVDEFHGDELKVSAQFSAIGPEQIFLSDMRELNVKGAVTVKSDVPVSLLWNLADNKIEISSEQKGTLSYESASEKLILSFSPGITVYDNLKLNLLTNERIIAILGKLKNKVYTDPLPVAKISLEKITWNPEWQVSRNGDASHLDISESGDLWAAWDNNTDYVIGRISSEGEVVTQTVGKGKILTFRAAKSSSQAESFAVIAGFMDDTVRTFNQSGKPAWNFKAELDPSFRIGDKYVAPWFSDPEQVTGVYDILADDLWGTGKEEIVIGRPVTLEFRTLKGELIRRLPTQWGTNSTLSLLRNPGGDSNKNIVLAGKFITGYPGQSAVNIHHENISDNLFNDAKRGWTFMSGWGQQGLSQLIAEDINNDSIPELITTITGHWNELRVWSSNISGLENNNDTASGNGITVMSGGTANKGSRVSNAPPLWMKYFGPYMEGTWIINGVLQRDPVDKMNDRFTKSLIVADLNGDKYKEIIVGLKNGWLHVFDHKGNLLWQKKFENGIRSLEGISGSNGRLAIGFSNGNIYLIDNTGNILQKGKLDSSVEKIIYAEKYLYAGTKQGTIVKFSAK